MLFTIDTTVAVLNPYAYHLAILIQKKLFHYRIAQSYHQILLPLDNIFPVIDIQSTFSENLENFLTESSCLSLETADSWTTSLS